MISPRPLRVVALGVTRFVALALSASHANSRENTSREHYSPYAGAHLFDRLAQRCHQIEPALPQPL